MRLDAGRDPPRDRKLEMDGDHLRLHVRAGLRRKSCDLHYRARPRRRLTPGLNQPAAPRNRSKPLSLNPKQPYQRPLDPYGLYRELSPRLGFFPDSVLDLSQLLIRSWLIAALFGPLLATLEPPPFRGPLHVRVPRLGKGLLRGSRLLARRGLRRCRGLRGWSNGWRRRSCHV